MLARTTNEPPPSVARRTLGTASIPLEVIIFPRQPARYPGLPAQHGGIVATPCARSCNYLDSPQPPAKSTALMLRADTPAPVFHDEEKRAPVTTQVHKVARDAYRFDVGGPAFSAGCDRATTLVAGARHVRTHRLSHGTCQLSDKRFTPSSRRRGRMYGRSRVKRSLSSASGINTARGIGGPQSLQFGSGLRLSRRAQNVLADVGTLTS